MGDAYKTETTLANLAPGISVRIKHLKVRGGFRERLLDLGFVPGSVVQAVMESPDRGMMAYSVKGAQVALRPEDANKIIVEDQEIPPHIPDSPAPKRPPLSQASLPRRATSTQLKVSEQLTVALTGNPNTGKSTIFNALTGLRQHVGNWPGKTVARLEGLWQHGDRRYCVVDLPGTYSLLSQSPEEEIARDFLFQAQPDCVVAVADATCLERNLNLALQIIELSPRVVLCVNLMDQAQRLGLTISPEKLEKSLGIPVVLTCAHRPHDIKHLSDVVDDVARGETRTRPVQIRYSAHIEEAMAEMTALVEPYVANDAVGRWVAMRLIDGDPTIQDWFEKQVHRCEPSVCYAV